MRIAIAIVGIFLMLGSISSSAAEDTLAAQNCSRFSIPAPNYFITGFGSMRYGGGPLLFQKDNQVKFRIALNYAVIGLKQSENGLFFGYVQTSFWNVYDRHSPLMANSYSPSAFLLYSTNTLGERHWYKPYLKIGLTHESNAAKGDDDRSCDRLVLEGRVGDHRQTPATASLSVWTPVRKMQANPDLMKYTGFAELSFYWEPFYRKKSSQIELLAVSATAKFNSYSSVLASVEVCAYYNPFFVLGANGLCMPTLMVQYFRGTGENLYDYKKQFNSLRFGVAFYP